ncbi:hypothetical protein DWUX_1826 [Desulfovibrio diazotrophicus]|nr:hypothetical protein DWUX_1826 [Desulfovibrio diazotrophicus]VVU42853.1 hypothetical protein DWUX_199 [Desulfovibrio diazotrophicus]
MLQRSSRATQRPFGKTPPRGFLRAAGSGLAIKAAWPWTKI